MLSAFASAFRTPDLRKKLLFTLGIIVVYRVGTHIPIPGVDYRNVQTCIDAAQANPRATKCARMVGLSTYTVVPVPRYPCA